MEAEKTELIVDMAALIASRAEQYEKVLVLCIKKEGGCYVLDNGMTVSEALFLVENFKHWVMCGIHGPKGPSQTFDSRSEA